MRGLTHDRMSRKPLLTPEQVVLVSLAVAALAGGFYFAGKSGSNPDAYSNDFNVYYHAAREVISGADPYQHSLGDWTPYIYPPLLAELIVPLGLLPVPAAAYLWFLTSAASIAAAAWMSASLAVDEDQQRETELSSRRAAIAACAVIVVLRFVLDTFNLGQVNAIVAALAVAHIYLYTQNRKALSAIVFVLAVSIKLTPALILLYHIARSRLKFAVACAVLLAGITVVSFLPFGSSAPDTFRTFWNRTVRNEQGYDFAFSGNQSLRGAVSRLRGQDAGGSSNQNTGQSRSPADPMTLLISLALLVPAVSAAVRARSELAAVSPFFCCMVLLSPLSWKAHFVMLILPVAYLLSLVRITRRRWLFVAAVLGAAFALLNLTSPRVIGLAAAEWADAHSLVFAGALLIFGACVAISLSTTKPEKRDVKF